MGVRDGCVGVILHAVSRRFSWGAFKLIKIRVDFAIISVSLCWSMYCGHRTKTNRDRALFRVSSRGVGGVDGGCSSANSW